MPRMKKELAADTEEIRRIVRKAERGAGAYPDKADVGVLNAISKLEYLEGKSPHGVPNMLLELDRKDEEIKRLHAQVLHLSAKLRKIHQLSNGWDEEA
jgi:hypothetical protein